MQTSAWGFASSRRSWWPGRICGGHGREPSPLLDPLQERSGPRHPVGGEQGGGDVPFEGIASAFHQPQPELMRSLIAHFSSEDYHTH